MLESSGLFPIGVLCCLICSAACFLTWTPSLQALSGCL